MSEPKRAEWYVYIVACADDSYYVGHTQDVDERLTVHNKGEGASWAAARCPVSLVYQELHASQPDAMRRERQIKKWSRAKKAALIAGDRVRLSQLSACRSSAER